LFNPYRKPQRIQGSLRTFEPDSPTPEKQDFTGSIVAVPERTPLWSVGHAQAEAIVFLTETEFQQIKRQGGERADLMIDGQRKRRTSANVVAQLQKVRRDATPYVLVSAHWDSILGPGADDNASGVAVLLELARSLKRRPAHKGLAVRFLFTGAEEEGLLGASAYVARHREELKYCRLVVNLDQVGGPGELAMELIEVRAECPTPGDAPSGPLRVWCTENWVMLPMPSLNHCTQPNWLWDMWEAVKRESEYPVSHVTKLARTTSCLLAPESPPPAS